MHNQATSSHSINRKPLSFWTLDCQPSLYLNRLAVCGDVRHQREVYTIPDFWSSKRNMAEARIVDDLDLTKLSTQGRDPAPPPTQEDDLLPDFEYKPLPEDGLFRLTDLHYRSPPDDLMCTVYRERLGQKPFTAVSYCWGRSDQPHIMKCRDPKKSRLIE